MPPPLWPRSRFTIVILLCSLFFKYHASQNAYDHLTFKAELHLNNTDLVLFSSEHLSNQKPLARFYQVKTDIIAEMHQNAFIPLTQVQKHIHTCGFGGMLNVEGVQIKKEMEQLKCRKESCRPQRTSRSRRSADSESSWRMKSSGSAGAVKGQTKLSLMWRPWPCWAEQVRGEESKFKPAPREEEQDEESQQRALLEGRREAAPGQRGHEETGPSEMEDKLRKQLAEEDKFQTRPFRGLSLLGDQCSNWSERQKELREMV